MTHFLMEYYKTCSRAIADFWISKIIRQAVADYIIRLKENRLHQNVKRYHEVFLLSRVDFFIYNSGFALFYQHVRHFHSSLAPFHIVCVHPNGCQKHFYVFNSFRRHWNRYPGSCRVGKNSELLIIFLSKFSLKCTLM
jgi:hypothetical protein